MGWEPKAPLPQQVSITSARSGRGQDQNTPQKWHRMLGQGDEQGSGRGEAKEEERGEEIEKEGEAGAKKTWGRFRRQRKERESKDKATARHGGESFRKTREDKGPEAPNTAVSFGSLLPMVQGGSEKPSLLW